MNDTQPIPETSTIELKAIGDLLGKDFKFFVPAYQRGYRWGEAEVRALLDDIFEFFNSDENLTGKFYCLQPLVVKDKGENQFELIDGQQRLTTLRLILDFAPDLGEKLFSLEYETRKETTEKYLNQLKSDETSQEEDNIDFFHLSQARKTIKDWFEKKGPAVKDKFLRWLTEGKPCLKEENNEARKVKFIWYQASKEEKGEALFTRLNMGKIPLNDAELIRALFLKKSPQQEKDSLSQLRMRIAQEWDEIERSFQSDDFWYFLGGGADNQNSRIELILEIVSETNEDLHKIKKEQGDFALYQKYQKYFLGNKNKEEELWKEIKKKFLILEGWYKDRVFFHLIGYLLVTGPKQSDKLSEISKNIIKRFKKWNGSSTKEEFKETLYSEIKDFLKIEDISTYLTEELSYGHKNVKNVLLLFNIATLLSDEKSNARFQFDRYGKENWDIEHISPQTDKIEITPTKFLEESLEFLKQNVEDKALLENIQKLFNENKDEKDKECLNKILQFFFPDKTDIDQIGNLTLLPKSNNCALGNKIFPEKRLQIIEWDRADYFIPVCTKNVFLKYYTKFPETPFYWSKNDMESYQKEIIGTLGCFFGGKINDA